MAASGRGRCAACGGILRPTHRFCPNCGAPRAAAPQAAASTGPALQVTGVEAARLEEQRRLVTVLFADLSGSTAMGERLDPEDLRQILASFFQVLAREIQHFGGTIDKYIGDAVMAVFGAPIAREDDPHRAIRAALASHAALARQNDTLQQRYGVRLALRIGVNTGEVVAGLMADDVSSAYMVTGDTVNTAQRLESAAPAGGVLVGELTYRLTRRAFLFDALDPLTLKGKAQPVAAYRVLGRSEELLDRDAPPFVGREAELARLHKLLAVAVSGRGQLVHIHGEPGVGKSRLLHEFVASLPETFSRVRARCLSHETATPYGLLADLMRRAFRIQQGDSQAAARAALQAIFAQLGEQVEDVPAGIFLEVLGHRSSSSLEPEVKRRILVSMLRRFIQGSARQGPLLLVAEDVHWIDAASGAVLKDVADAIGSAACLLVTTSREPALPWPATVVALHPLDESSAEVLLDRAAGAPLDSKLRSTVLERTGGNPLFIGEVARTIAAKTTLTVPATIQELLAARLDGLEPGPRRVAQRASVIGRTFSTRILAWVAPDEPLEPALATLEREAFIEPRQVVPEPTYSFRHALMQEVAYEGQLRSQRRALHGQVGAAIEELHADRLEESVDALAFQYDRSDNDEKALHWLVVAGDRAKALFANEEAVVAYEKALKRARDGDGAYEAGGIWERVGEVQTVASRYDEAIAAFRASRDRSPAPGRHTIARIHRKTGVAHVLKGAYAEALEAYTAGIAAAEGAAPDPEAARLYFRLGVLQTRRGDYGAAQQALSKAVEIGTTLAADDVVAEGLKGLANVATFKGQLKLAVDLFQRSRAIYERLEDLSGVCDVRNGLGIVYRRMNQPEEALTEFQATLALSERIGNPLHVGRARNNIGEVERTRGNLTEAIGAYQQAMSIWSSIGYMAGVANALIGMGGTRVESGDTARARAELLEAEKRFSALGSTMYFPDLYRYLASVELASGNLDAATRYAERSLSFAHAAGARHQEGMTQRVLGEIALHRGHREVARALLLDSRQTLAELGEESELARTEAVLGRF